MVRPRDKKLCAGRMVSALGLSKTKACSLTGLARSMKYIPLSIISKGGKFKGLTLPYMCAP